MRRLIIALVVITVVAPSAQRGGQTGPPTPPRTIVGPAAPPSTVVVSIEQLELAVDRIEWDRWFPTFPGASGRMDLSDLQSGPSMDVRMLTAALQAKPTPTGTGNDSYSARLRATAVRALGRMENPKDIATIAQLVADSDATVRTAAARAITQCLWHTTDEHQAVNVARFAILTQLVIETDKDAKNALCEALGDLPYGPNDSFREILIQLGAPISSSPIAEAGGAGALTGLETLTRRFPNVTLAPPLVRRLRQLAAPSLGAAAEPPELHALMILRNIKDDDAATIKKAALMDCDGSGDALCGFEFRLIGLQMINALDARYVAAYDHGLHDAAWQVRYQALTIAAQLITTTGTCAPLMEAFDDRVDYVARHAIELVKPSCAERDDLTKQLTNLADGLGDGANNAAWQTPVVALETLVKFAPDAAHAIVKETAASHPVWQVRAAAARIAGVLYDEDLAVSLAHHDASAPQGLLEANVRTAALKALRAMSSKQLAPSAIDALADPDDELVYTAATLLKDSGAHDAIQPLVDALTRLSRRLAPTPRPGSKPTSAPTLAQMATLASVRDSARDPRLAILAALQRLALPEDMTPITSSLRYLLTDTDPVVAVAAADVMTRLSGTRAQPRPTKLAPIQPAESEIDVTKQRCARIQLDNGKGLDLTMVMPEAPIAAARFLTLATDGFYNGLTFHRVEVNNFVQAGSPDANELSTGDRFIRDEVGLPMIGTSDYHGGPRQFGVIALVTRGRDTGGGQFFIPLVTLPGLDHEFTVFATFKTSEPVTPGWIDLLRDAQIVEGTKISSIKEGPCKAK